MEFGPAHPKTSKEDICLSCGNLFEMVGDNCLVENFCPPCQARFRIKEALEAQRKGVPIVSTNWWDKRHE